LTNNGISAIIIDMSTGARAFWVMMLVIGSILAVVVLVIIGRSLFGNSKIKQTEAQQINLEEYIRADTSVRFEVVNDVIADEEHQTIQMNVSQNNRTVKVLQGYENKTIASKTYGNNTAAYRDFMVAISNADFTAKTLIPDGPKNFDGLCPNGTRYRLSLFENDELVQETWKTSCAKESATSATLVDPINLLFQKQFTEYNDVLTEARNRD
jgi:low affinity Fe/Cu permease